MMKIKNSLFVIAFLLLILFCYKINNDNKSSEIRIAYTNDLSGFIFKDIENDKNSGIDFKEYKFMDLGDCCGSNAQFAFATNQIDLAILCPDAIKYLDEVENDNYISIGNVIYDSEILISEKDKASIKIVGYMNRRERQREILRNYFGDDVSFVPMTSLSLGYALKSNVIDAAYVDISTYLQLDYDGVTLTNDNATQTIVINKKVRNSDKIKKIITLYNEKVRQIKNEDELYDFLSKHLKLNNKEAVLKKWRGQKTKFGMLKQED